MNITIVKPGDKFILSEDFKKLKTNTVISIVSMRACYSYYKIRFRTIINKSIIKECYNGLVESDYSEKKYRWRDEDNQRGEIRFNVKDKEVIDLLNSCQPYNEEYKQLTTLNK